VIIVLNSCDDQAIYRENKPLSVSGWNQSDTLVFDFNIKDIEPKYNLSLQLRHRDVYRWMNIYLKVITRYPDQSEVSDIINVPLADEGGLWYGKCTGDICFVKVPILSRFRFKDSGNYQIKIIQEMRTDVLENMLDVGMVIEKAPKLKIKKDEE
jgi:gliding motility-associated lipoprotein GldH